MTSNNSNNSTRVAIVEIANAVIAMEIVTGQVPPGEGQETITISNTWVETLDVELQALLTILINKVREVYKNNGE